MYATGLTLVGSKMNIWGNGTYLPLRIMIVVVVGAAEVLVKW